MKQLEKKTWLWQVPRFGFGPVHSEKKNNNITKINKQTNKQKQRRLFDVVDIITDVKICESFIPCAYK